MPPVPPTNTPLKKKVKKNIRYSDCSHYFGSTPKQAQISFRQQSRSNQNLITIAPPRTPTWPRLVGTPSLDYAFPLFSLQQSNTAKTHAIPTPQSKLHGIPPLLLRQFRTATVEYPAARRIQSSLRASRNSSGTPGRATEQLVNLPGKNRLNPVRGNNTPAIQSVRPPMGLQ